MRRLETIKMHKIYTHDKVFNREKLCRALAPCYFYSSVVQALSFSSTHVKNPIAKRSPTKREDAKKMRDRKQKVAKAKKVVRTKKKKKKSLKPVGLSRRDKIKLTRFIFYFIYFYSFFLFSFYLSRLYCIPFFTSFTHHAAISCHFRLI